MNEGQQFLELAQTMTAALVGLFAGLLAGIGLALLWLALVRILAWRRR